MKQVHRHSEAGRYLIARAERAQADADRAFRRVMQREVKTASAATRLQRKADEAWADVRIRVTHGAMIEAGHTEAEIVEAESAYMQNAATRPRRTP